MLEIVEKKEKLNHIQLNQSKLVNDCFERGLSNIFEKIQTSEKLLKK